MFELYQFLTDESQEKIKKQLEEAESKGIAEGEKIGRAEGEKLGMANAIINNIKSLMQNLNTTAENAMKMLSIPQEEQSFYLAQLNL